METKSLPISCRTKCKISASERYALKVTAVRHDQLNREKFAAALARNLSVFFFFCITVINIIDLEIIIRVRMPLKSKTKLEKTEDTLPA